MNIQIVGLGIVGTAQAFLCQKLKHNVIGYDIRSMSHPYCKVNNSIVGDVDMTFICTPETVLEEVIKNLKEIGNKGLIVVRSTSPLGNIGHLSEKYNTHICHCPEFLREKTYMEDIMNPNVIVIGQCCPEHGNMLKSFYKPMNKPIAVVNTTTSELAKLTMNSYLSVLITFWNEIDELCQKLDLDTKTISDITKYDPRMSHYGNEFFGNPYSGKCLPKDTRHLIMGFKEQNLNPLLFEACEKFNNKFLDMSEKDNLKNRER